MRSSAGSEPPSIGAGGTPPSSSGIGGGGEGAPTGPPTPGAPPPGGSVPGILDRDRRRGRVEHSELRRPRNARGRFQDERVGDTIDGFFGDARFGERVLFAGPFDERVGDARREVA